MSGWRYPDSGIRLECHPLLIRQGSEGDLPIDWGRTSIFARRLPADFGQWNVMSEDS